MPVKKVPKSGVYRAKSGHATYLQEGAEVDADLLDNYSFDGEATEKRGQESEPDYFRTVRDAPQNQPAEDTFSGRMVSGAPENKAMSRSAGQKADSELADDAAKGKK